MSIILKDINNSIQEMEESLGKKILKHVVNIGVGAAIGAGAAHLMGGAVTGANAAGADAVINPSATNSTVGAITGGLLSGATGLIHNLNKNRQRGNRG